MYMPCTLYMCNITESTVDPEGVIAQNIIHAEGEHSKLNTRMKNNPNQGKFSRMKKTHIYTAHGTKAND